MTKITRRTFMAVAAVAMASAPAAASAAGPWPRALSRIRHDVVGQGGNASITVSLSPDQDVTVIRYTITDVGSVPDVFTVWYSDLDNGRQSRRLVYPLDPGGSASAEVYGRSNHSFLVNVCQSDGTCFTVGPLGPSPAAVPLGLQAHPPQR